MHNHDCSFSFDCSPILFRYQRHSRLDYCNAVCRKKLFVDAILLYALSAFHSSVIILVFLTFGLPVLQSSEHIIASRPSSKRPNLPGTKVTKSMARRITSVKRLVDVVIRYTLSLSPERSFRLENKKAHQLVGQCEM